MPFIDVGLARYGYYGYGYVLIEVPVVCSALSTYQNVPFSSTQ